MIPNRVCEVARRPFVDDTQPDGVARARGKSVAIATANLLAQLVQLRASRDLGLHLRARRLGLDPERLERPLLTAPAPAIASSLLLGDPVQPADRFILRRARGTGHSEAAACANVSASSSSASSGSAVQHARYDNGGAL